MTDPLDVARSHLTEARARVAEAGGVQWSGPAAVLFRARLDDLVASLDRVRVELADVPPPVARRVAGWVGW